MKTTNPVHLNIQLLFILFIFIASEVHTCEGLLTVTDIDGNIYKTVVIGRQEWMAENLRSTRFTDGTIIPGITDMTEWVRTDSPAYSWYDNDISNREFLGGLYNWHAVKTGKLCPEGCRVPSDSDWTILIDYLGGIDSAVEKLEAKGFYIIPGGYRYGYYWGSGIFYEKGINGYWWTSTGATATHIWSRTINRGKSMIYRSYFTENNGFSVRCIKCN